MPWFSLLQTVFSSADVQTSHTSLFVSLPVYLKLQKSSKLKPKDEKPINVHKSINSVFLQMTSRGRQRAEILPAFLWLLDAFGREASKGQI